VDTWWQTETGGHALTPLGEEMLQVQQLTQVHPIVDCCLALSVLGSSPAHITPMDKPGSATFPFYGVQPCLINPATGKEVEGNGVDGHLCIKVSQRLQVQQLTQIYTVTNCCLCHFLHSDPHNQAPWPGMLRGLGVAGRGQERFEEVRIRIHWVVGSRPNDHTRAHTSWGTLVHTH
jgi:hypothetical protein